MRIIGKIEEIEQYLDELKSFMPADFEQYQHVEKKAACERYFEKIVEALVDLSFLVIKEKHLKLPEEEKETFALLSAEGIITADLAAKMKDAKGMRNIIAHDYGVIDNEMVFDSIANELINDSNSFLECIKRYLNLKQKDK